MAPSQLTPVGHFFADTFKGLLIFSAMTSTAVGLNLLVRYLDGLHVDRAIIIGLSSAEYATFTVDLIIYARFLLTTVFAGWSHFSPARRQL
jgi:hypothetical protein